MIGVVLFNENMTPYLNLSLKTSNYQFLWLKYVTGFDQSEHCARCLLGPYSKLIGRGASGYRGHLAGVKAQGPLEESRAPLIYLCGVSVRGFDDNLHVPMVPDPSSQFVFEDDNIKLLVAGLRRFPVQPVPGAEGLAPRLYVRCRNWQVAWHFFPNDRKDLAVCPGIHAGRKRKGQPKASTGLALPFELDDPDISSDDGDFIF